MMKLNGTSGNDTGNVLIKNNFTSHKYYLLFLILLLLLQVIIKKL